MKKIIALLALILTGCFVASAETQKPLRIFIRAGEKTHGPGAHDGPRFLKEWTPLLNERGTRTIGAKVFPTAEQLADTDVLVMYCANGGNISPEQRASLDQFLKRGGGMVVIHDAVGGNDPEWFKTIIGGAWENGFSKYYEGDIALYYLDRTHPITRNASNFDLDDEMYWDMRLMPEAHILAGTYQPDARNKHDGRIMPSVYDVAPQMWTYEKDNYRAFVSIPGHNYKTFDLPQYRAILMRAIAWAGKRDVDSLASKAELTSLRYPENGPTAPEQAAKKIVVAPGFNIHLVASEPLIDKPISMDWDPKGRLWIAETPEYPFRKDRSIPAYDRISILEDTRHDGHMDKKTVFYEGLDLVTSMVFYKDGVIVSQAPYIIRLRDTKGRGKADTREILFSGFGTNDTHAVISNLRWGMDGWIYATVGYSRGDVYSGDHSKHFGKISDGVFRFKPDGSAIEQVSSKNSNTWGVDFAPDDEIFFSQANGNHIDHVVMPEAALTRGRAENATSFQNIEDHTRSFPLMSWTKQAYVQIDWVGNFTAAAGACIYDGGAWPDKYNYTYYVAEPTINIVHQDFLHPKGVTYVASKDPERLEQEFIASSDLWFRPIHQRVGPDGAMYVLDFYNQAVVHNDTRGTRHDPQSNAALRPDRDHYFGRIWRVQHDQAKKLTIPNLDHARPSQLVKALEHPNEWVRMTALRLLTERAKNDVVPQLEKLANSESASAYARIHALWALHNLNEKSPFDMTRTLRVAVNSKDSAVAKNALRIVEFGSVLRSQDQLVSAVAARANDSDPRVRLEALIALGRSPSNIKPSEMQALIEAYPNLKDQWLESAFLGVANQNPEQFIEAALNSAHAEGFATLVYHLAGDVADRQDAAVAAKLLVLASSKPSSVDGLKLAILESLSRQLKPETVPAWSPELAKALRGFLASPNHELAAEALPLATHWDTKGALANDVNGLVQRLITQLNDASQTEGDRGQLVRILLSVRQRNASIMPSVTRILGSSASPVLQRRVIETLGGLPDAEVGQALVDAYPNLPGELQDAVLNQLFKRADWSQTLLTAIESGKVKLGTLGPVAINRLRTHSNSDVAARANKIIDSIRGPEAKEKDTLIAQFTPIVVQPGDPAHGKQLFTQNCAVCHKFNGEGKDVAPDLTGMGAHGPAELIVHVLDPNREVEPNYYAYSIDTTDGETYDGVIARENATSLTLRNAAGDTEIKTKNIKNRRNTGLSLMPNGFESLGGETLRDILSYLCAGEANYRILDLHTAFTASSAKGLFISEDDLQDTFNFRKFGLMKVGDVPFDLVNPQKSPSGKNVIALKGGMGAGKARPQQVEIPNVNVKATRLDFLGGVGGWAYPWGGGHKDIPVAKVTVHYADQENEEIVLKNGVEFADWFAPNEVPGSQSVPNVTRRGQVRWFSKPLKHQGTIKSITLSSYDNEVSPVFLSITADSNPNAPQAGESSSAAPSASADASAEFKWTPGTTHVLILGGGSSHDFERYFNRADSATLSSMDKVSVNYTSKPSDVTGALKDVDVLYQSSNQDMKDPALRKAIFDFANAGHGLVLVHPGLWYNWKDWPEYNSVLIGGGARSHDRYGEFEVVVKEPNNPIMAGVPATFKLSDELYHSEIDTNGTPIEVLAEARNLTTGKTYPSIWIVKHPKARIVCIALGHDAAAHDLQAYKTILENAVKWAAGK